MGQRNLSKLRWGGMTDSDAVDGSSTGIAMCEDRDV